MLIRPVTTDDAERLFEMMCRLDEETEYMMYEPGERESRPHDPEKLKAALQPAVSGTDLLLIAETDGGEIAGYLWAERGRFNRTLHTAYIVTGIRRAYRRQRIGAEFFDRLDRWAEENQLVRLELTVECANTAAKSLYEKHGFRTEGLREKSMKVNGSFADEFYMAKILRCE